MKSLKNFFGLYSVNIIRFFTNQIVMSILGLSVGLATIYLDNLAVGIIGCVFSIGFLCFLQYDNTFQIGEKHHFRPMDANRPKKTLGFKIAALASVPLFLLILIGIFFEFILQNDDASAICKFIYYCLHGSYTQLHVYLTAWISASALSAVLWWGLSLLYMLPAIFSSALGYLLGSLDRPLRTFFGFKHGNAKKKEK